MDAQPCILLYIFCIQYVIAHSIISDTTDDHCISKELCELAGIIGHVDCISDTCVCVNNTKIFEFQNMRGCFKKNKLGDECEFHQDCWNVKDSQCSQLSCKKTCECLPNRHIVAGNCTIIENKTIGTYCETDYECNNGLICSSYKCNCKLAEFYANDKCIALEDYNMCRNDSDCSNKADSFCEKTQTDLGFCQLKGKRLQDHPCSTTDGCPINGHVDCQRGSCTCVRNSISNNNGCNKQNGIGEKCQFDEECNNNTVCEGGNQTNIGRCMCPKNHAYHENTCINIKYQPSCARNSDCVVKNSICKDNVCKCSNGTILLNDTCIELKGQKYGDFCHKECASSDTTCIRSDHSSTIGVCGCHDNYVRNTSVCTPRKISDADVDRNLDESESTNTATIISVEIYCLLFIHFIIIYVS